MKKPLFPFKIAAGILLLTLVGACGNGSQAGEEYRVVDSLNRVAYAWRYRNIDSADYYATRALSAAEDYSLGRALSYNTKGFVAFQQMDFVGARNYLERVQTTTRHQVILLMSDVQLMRLCQRTSENKAFYDYYNRALARIRRIREEQHQLCESDFYYFRGAENDFWIIATQYYLNLQQQVQAADAFAQLTPTHEAMPDTAQLAAYFYIRGLNFSQLSGAVDNTLFTESEDLMQCIMLSHAAGYPLYQGLVYQYYAEKLTRQEVIYELKVRRRPLYYFLNKEVLSDSLLPIYLARKSYSTFREIKDWYRLADAYRTLSSCHLAEQNYLLSVCYLDSALRLVNQHHDSYYREVSTTHPLQLFNALDTISVEKQWLSNPEVITIPDWIAGIREQLSVTFSAMGMKQYSDYNRNIYLDILEVTRQDRALENRVDGLRNDSRWMNFLLGLVALLLGAFFLIIRMFNRTWKRQNGLQMDSLRELLERCRLITSTPENSQEVEAPGEGTLEELLKPYREWMVQNREIYQELGDAREKLQEEFAMHKLRITENKRQNVEKRAKLALVNGITPYLNRAINEINRLQEGDYCTERLHYIDELVNEINLYNDILAEWIQLHQGELNLQIERFELNSLFQLIAQSHHSFEQQEILFQVQQTETVVKADRALTLFMLSTLTDNARKFTPAGGTVTVAAHEAADYVEISVTDTGVGLSDEDIHTILDTKVYDSKEIGKENGALAHRKGNGFGLLNCKGIIEKYRKTNPLFAVCKFGIVSEVGQGSRFYFRLPKVIIKSLLSILVLLSTSWLTACKGEIIPDELAPQTTIPPYEANLTAASAFADSCYYSNISGYYQDALRFVDSAVVYLNQHYLQVTNQAGPLLCGASHDYEIEPAEVVWWANAVSTDYQLILDIRNEAAVAALALHNLTSYQHNNEIYRQLYKLVTTQDDRLRAYCEAAQHANSNRRVALAILLILGVLLLLGYYYMVLREQLMFRFNLQQVHDINRKVLEVLSVQVSSEEVPTLPQRLLEQISSAINEIETTQALVLQLVDKNQQEIAWAADTAQYDRTLVQCLIKSAIDQGERVKSLDGLITAFPLTIDTGERLLCIGALVFSTPTPATERETLLNELMVRYIALVLLQSVVYRLHQYATLEEAEDERRRARYEEEQLHIQNMVLDNCLSTLKHETMYYPNRIKQLVAKMQHAPNPQQVDQMRDMVTYYQQIFTLLSSQAARQVEQVNFRRNRINVAQMLAQMSTYTLRMGQKQQKQINLVVDAPESLHILGDNDMVRLLLENLIAASLTHQPKEATLLLTAQRETRFIRVTLYDRNFEATDEVLAQLFMPHVERIPYLLCKQIIRDHDEYSSHMGCRIYAERSAQGGVEIWFTLPLIELK